jgi:hypothetical protein
MTDQPQPENTSHLHFTERENRDKVHYKGKTWTRRGLAAFLNLVILPGTGSFIVGRRIDGVIQICLCTLGVVLKLTALASLTIWMSPILQGLGVESLDRVKFEDSLPVARYMMIEASNSPPPEILGLNSMHVLWIGVAMILVGWVYGLVSVLLPPKLNGKGRG